ncbi:ribonuclease H2 complex subunit Rnh201 [Schizosaccharomyces pombe]|uniref:Ribonuclease H2 subunit A n=1 Tax=Schizosaccharomyces pombe (strain 972 / ATCC 24843) TaxID=284812 RepID=RNH2A_SCHPO|nr:putative ribonuclease H2 complex subunit Rnh201 [Schizosaccharomyces pombe]Q10236.1 RecName: Full=Ribonuclease H2 subunit A; Short=RNase H2 subunit A; AltName: Full=Ribonuclease HI large subunit; Short=RNase HI large subunit; AltName: Full=Ribonuclease HI subunit A [Schizosaccharomyces pombe 972h-]CAA93552.1 ribonuclease H2 complex subunit Rnh201 (predicted) [Schizosaccharomyces pombe]|eukprot:NP_593684.1 putative ribonuclease H2 complex subunit Rnh201 [Schizosaccharomyces pombe]
MKDDHDAWEPEELVSDNNSSENELQEDQNSSITFLPPSVNKSNPAKSNYYHSTVTDDISKSQPYRLGVDEAGRGPVLGPMVYAVAYCPVDFDLTNYGFADSKTLASLKREELLKLICNKSNELGKNVGWSTMSISARELAAGMLRYRNKYNLNLQAHDTTIDLIKKVYESGINVTEIYVDTVGPPISYQEKLQAHFPQAKVTVTKKADSLFPIVSLASICAKVTRDIQLECARESIRTENWGSGYSSDARTTEWLKVNVDKIFGWKGDIVRYSWKTAKDLLELPSKSQSSIEIDWHEDDDTPTLNFTQKKKPNPASRSWFGSEFYF